MKTIVTVERRGALLLLVLGMLSLFVLVGTVTLTLATRARTTSRAFSAATAGTAVGPMLARKQLEEAVLELVRGGTSARAAGLSETLLGDMYGTAPGVEGQLTSVTDRGTLVEATITVASGTSVTASDLCGRVVTFMPKPDTGDAITSHRLLRVTGTGTFTCWFSRLQSGDSIALPKPPCTVLVNPPAFRDEAYDAYDAANPWLTQVALEDGRVSAVPRPAFAPAGTAPVVDNDNDGVKDGVWLSNILASRPAPGGGRFEFDASYLVLDLDGRVNVNAHGSRTAIDFPAAGDWWTGSADVPIGSGYGPADVDASRVFVGPAAAAGPGNSQAVPEGPPVAADVWKRLLSDTSSLTLTATVSSVTQRRPVAAVGRIDGRHGPKVTPGAAGNDLTSQRNELVYVTGTDATGKAVKSPFVDLPCAIKVSGTDKGGPVPTLMYYRPTWPAAATGYDDDPYELRLDVKAPRPFDLRSGTAAADNPFTLADLESVLRQFDVDATTVSPRLAVALDAESQRSRMLVTTDSWDTPIVTGTVAGEIGAFMKTLTCAPGDVMSPDVMAGLRFDINRPFATGTAELASKQDYCKHLYTLLVALGQPANESTAQWVANVVDFRDTDSVFTRFQYDTTPADGWNRTQPDGSADPGWKSTNVVWGIERPELVIAQTIAFYVMNSDTTSVVQDALYVSLYRPSWSEEQWQRGTNGKPALYKTLAAPAVNLGDKSPQSSQPTWRLRIGGTTTSGTTTLGTTVRFDKPGSSDKEIAGVFRKTGGTTDDSTMQPDSYLVVMPTFAKTTGSSKTSTTEVQVPVDAAFKKFEINSGGVFKAEHWPGAATYHQGADTIVFLERLEDPTKPWNDNPADPAYNPYVILDRMGIKRVNRTGGGNNWKTYFRKTLVWNNGPFDHVDEAGILPLNPTQKAWLPWPNRPFISQAELVMVPQGGGAWRYWDNDLPKNKRAANPYYCLPTPKLLEAAIVPSRFAGSQVSVNPATLAAVGMDKIPFNQLSRYREPGRVNLNTVVSNSNCVVPERNDAVWWATLGADAVVTLDEFRQAGPATSIVGLLTLNQAGGIYLDTPTNVPNGNSWKKLRNYDLSPSDAYATAIRLANVATIRSHMFAVWVTLRVRDTSPGSSTSYHRVFAIVDRSRPVGYTEGGNLNVHDTIRVLRYLE